MAKKFDFSAIVQAVTDYRLARATLNQKYTARPYVPKDGPCPDDAAALCRAMIEWTQAYYAWALSVEDRLPGGPGDTTPPPPPPIKG